MRPGNSWPTAGIRALLIAGLALLPLTATAPAEAHLRQAPATDPATSPVVISAGHVDIASLVQDSRLVTKAKDDTSGAAEPIFRDLTEVVFHATDAARTTVPANEDYRFLGDAGTNFWLLPASQQPDILWPGWSTELIAREAIRGGVEWTLTDLTGPGDLALYESGTFGRPVVRWNSRDGVSTADTLTIPPGTHAHGNWAFSAEGTYCLAFDRTAQLADGATHTASSVLAVAVGNIDPTSLNPTDCFPASDEKPTTPDTAPVPADQLTAETAGPVKIDTTGATHTPGQRVSIATGHTGAQTWMSVWLGDQWLGWLPTASHGTLTVTVPSSTPDGSYPLVVKSIDGSLLGWTTTTVHAAPNPDEPDDPDPDPTPAKTVWNVPHGKVNAHGATVLNNGHVDIASLVKGSALTTQIKDTSRSATAVWRDVDKTVLQLLPRSKTSVPNTAAYSFLGTAGSPIYQVTQTQQSQLLWPGWSTESIPAAATTGGVGWSLTDISGPGHFALYSTGSFGEPTVLFNTRDAITARDQFTIGKTTHAHGSWAFSAEGNYCLSMQRITQLTSGKTVSDSFVLAVAVGTADVMSINPAQCGEHVSTTPKHTVNVPTPTSAGPSTPTTATHSTTGKQCTPRKHVLSAGHIDYAARIVNGKLQSLIGDDTSTTKVYREPSGVILWLKPSAKVTIPAGFGAVGPAGSTIWQIPQSQNPDIIWLGWNTELLNATNASGTVTWSVASIDGPGSVSVFLTGAFGGIETAVFTNSGSYQIPLGVHAHGNWAFSSQGVYRMTMTHSVTLANGQRSTDTEVLTVAVGDVDLAALAGSADCGTTEAVVTAKDSEGTARSAAQLAAEARNTTADDTDAATSTPTASTHRSGVTDPTTDPVPLLFATLGGLFLVSASGTGVLWWRQRRPAGQDRP